MVTEAGQVKLFSSGSGDYWIAARDRGEACRFLVSELGFLPGDDEVCDTKEIPEKDWPEMRVNDEDFSDEQPVDVAMKRALRTERVIPFRFAGTDY